MPFIVPFTIKLLHYMYYIKWIIIIIVEDVSSALITALMCLPYLKANGCFKELNSFSISPLFNTVVASSFFVLLLNDTLFSVSLFVLWGVSVLPVLADQCCLTRAFVFFFGYRILPREIQVKVYADYSRSSRNFLLSLGLRKPDCLGTCVFPYPVLNLICSKVNLKSFYQLQNLPILCFFSPINETWWILGLYFLPFILL